ncbi:MAG: MBOAT family protein [Firmicutes bacterium]|nr:MBOAT family protein [Bacillota bacterium]
MVFSSATFLFFFLPCLLLLYFAVPARFRMTRNLILLAFSMVFYAFGGVKFVGLLLCSIGINYFSGLLASGDHPKHIRKTGVVLACVLGLALLGWFKYAGFFAEIINSAGLAVPVPQITLPIGISFFTFQGLSYVIDVYRGDAECQRNPFGLALYIALFPQLVAGPIVRYTTIESEILDRRETLEDFSAGTVRFILGLGKKMILANPMGEIADAIFEQNTLDFTTGAAWTAALAYTFQIYFDFSAYSDMAIGLGRMFGFHFLENFNYPYIASSITEFWTRWHISLSTWFRDYVYFPLGGSYCSVAKNIRNLAVVWLLTGMWHGAAWNYVFWGLWYLCFLLIEKFLLGRFLAGLPSVLKHVYTLLVVIAGWVFFRAPDLGFAAGMLSSMAGFGSGGGLGEMVYYFLEYWPEWILCLIAALPVKVLLQTILETLAGGWGSSSGAASWILIWGPKLFAAGVMAVSYAKLVTGSFNPFIYFQF